MAYGGRNWVWYLLAIVNIESFVMHSGLIDHHCHLLLAYYYPFDENKKNASPFLQKSYAYQKQNILEPVLAKVRAGIQGYDFNNSSFERLLDELKIKLHSQFNLQGINLIDRWLSYDIAQFNFYTVNVCDALLNIAVLKDYLDKCGRCGSSKFNIGIGMHPYHLEPNINMSSFGMSLNEEIAREVKLISYLKEHYPQALKGGLGEIGLDKRLSVALSEQIEVLRSYLLSTMHFNLPYSFHCVKAYDELYKLLNSQQFKGKITGCVHGFNGSCQQALALNKLGLKIGLGRSLLGQQNEKKITALLEYVPLKDILLESDFDGSSSLNYDDRVVAELDCKLQSLAGRLPK